MNTISHLNYISIDALDNPKKPRSLLVFLHGYGASNEELSFLATYIRKQLPNTTLIAPNAPFKCDVGMGYQWFALKSLDDLNYLMQGATHASKYLNDFIDFLSNYYQIPKTHIHFLGFSQGSITLLYTYLRSPSTLGVAIAHSGSFLHSSIQDQQIKNPNPKILVIHGTLDEVLPLYHYEITIKSLEILNIKFSSILEPTLQHSISTKTLQHSIDFIKQYS